MASEKSLFQTRNSQEEQRYVGQRNQQENPFIDEMSTGLFSLPGLPSVGFEDSFDPEDDNYDRDSR